MTLIWIDPYEVHFGDQKLEREWTKDKVEQGRKTPGWQAIGVKGISKELMLSVIGGGIVDPIIVYTVDRDPYLQSFILKDQFIEPSKKSGWNPTGIYCWRGTQRLRMARLLDYKTINCLLLDEKEETPPRLDETQKYFKKEIRLFVEPHLKRWDVMGVGENGMEVNQVLY